MKPWLIKEHSLVQELDLNRDLVKDAFTCLRDSILRAPCLHSSPHVTPCGFLDPAVVLRVRCSSRVVSVNFVPHRQIFEEHNASFALERCSLYW